MLYQQVTALNSGCKESMLHCMCVFSFSFFHFLPTETLHATAGAIPQARVMEAELNMRTYKMILSTLTSLSVNVRTACVDSRIFSVAIPIGYARIYEHMLYSKNRIEFLPFNRCIFPAWPSHWWYAWMFECSDNGRILEQYKILHWRFVWNSMFMSVIPRTVKLIVVVQHTSLWWNSFLSFTEYHAIWILLWRLKVMKLKSLYFSNTFLCRICTTFDLVFIWLYSGFLDNRTEKCWQSAFALILNDCLLSCGSLQYAWTIFCLCTLL